MPEIDRVKRQMLRQLVQQNVDLIKGRPPRPLRRRARALRQAGRVLALLLLPLGLLGSSRLLSSLAVEPAPPPAAAGTSSGGAAAIPVAAGAPAAPAPDPGTLPAPQPVDASVFPLEVRKVALDPGHGGGSVGTHTPEGLLEKELTLDVARRLRRLLEARAFEVVMTREDDRSITLDRRAELANRAGADIFVSIHVNWIENRQARGVETYYLGATDDPFLTRLAAAENRESGYSMADLRKLLDRIYAGVRQGHSRQLAEVVQGSLYRSLRKVNPELGDRGVKAAPFLVLLSTEMPAILAEVSCLSNEEEAGLLAKPLYRQYIAEALADGVRSYADAVARRGEKGI